MKTDAVKTDAVSKIKAKLGLTKTNSTYTVAGVAYEIAVSPKDDKTIMIYVKDKGRSYPVLSVSKDNKDIAIKSVTYDALGKALKDKISA